MEHPELRDELICSICLSLYTDPVSLRCGHVFCRSCIVSALDAQEAAGGYSCPDCRAQYPERPALEKNRKLRNIAKHFISSYPEQNEVKTFCTYCEFPHPAVKTCLQCETSFCAKHLNNHNKLTDHVLIEPSTSLEIMTCPAHKKVMKYFCTEHGVCVCVACFAFGEHKGHLVEEIALTSKKKEAELRTLMDKWAFERIETEATALKLKKHVRTVNQEANVLTKKIANQFKEFKKELEDLEKTVLSEISRQASQISTKFSSVVEELEDRSEGLAWDISRILDMINKKDVISILQAEDDHVGDGDETYEGDEVLLYTMGDLNVGVISETLQKGMSEFLTHIEGCSSGSRVLPIILDVNTAHNKMEISEDLKTASASDVKHVRPQMPSRFTIYNQVLSINRFTEGQHYWEVETSSQGIWDIGLAYSSIDREGKSSGIGDNKQSWCLRRYTTKYMVAHNSKAKSLLIEQCSPIIGMYLNYEAGLLVFYELCDQERHLFRHLHTFKTDFQEPLHAAFYVDDGAWIKVLI